MEDDGTMWESVGRAGCMALGQFAIGNSVAMMGCEGRAG